MRYHIYHAQSPLIVRHDWNVDEDFVRKMVKAYLRGELMIKIKGKNYSVGSESLLIYENPKQAGASGILIDSMDKIAATKSHYSKDYFEKTFKNVTDTYLQGRAWAELRDDYYNIYINDGQNKPVITVLDRREVESFLAEWSLGSSSIWIAARRIDLDNPKSIKIFNIEFEWLSKDRGSIKSNIKKYVDTVHKGSFKIEALEYFGKDITDMWDIKPFGRVKPKQINFDWNSIHPIISKVARERFKTPHFADAVEAAFKELNDVVKKEYLKIANEELDGAKLMRTALAHTNPKIKLSENTTESEKNIQEGYMNLFAGAMIGIRNPKAHSNVEIDEQDAWEKIILASHLMKIWDKRLNHR